MPVTADDLPAVRGKYVPQADMSAFTWFRVGGPADILFSPLMKKTLRRF